MAIATLADYEAAAKQRVYFQKTMSGTTANKWANSWSFGAVPAAGSNAIGSTTQGVVPTNATTGALAINAFSGIGYLTYAEFNCIGALGNPPSWRLSLFDRLFHSGSHAFNASDTLSSQPSYSSRVPGTTDFTGLQIWAEVASAFTGSPTVTVTYTNQDGNAGATTGAFSLGTAPAVGGMVMLPLAAGDSGVQKIESVTCAVATVGTFNVLVLRPLWTGFMWPADHGSGPVFGLDRAGLVVIPSTACLMVSSNSVNNNQLTDGFFEIASA